MAQHIQLVHCVMQCDVLTCMFGLLICCLYGQTLIPSQLSNRLSSTSLKLSSVPALTFYPLRFLFAPHCCLLHWLTSCVWSKEKLWFETFTRPSVRPLFKPLPYYDCNMCWWPVWLSNHICSFATQRHPWILNLWMNYLSSYWFLIKGNLESLNSLDTRGNINVK